MIDFASYENPQRITTQGAKHLYEVGVSGSDGKPAGKLEIEANSRAHARKLAEKHGHVVRDINMVG